MITIARQERTSSDEMRAEFLLLGTAFLLQGLAGSTGCDFIGDRCQPYLKETAFTIGLRYRIRIVDKQDRPVQGVEVKVEYYKRHCGGFDSDHTKEESVTTDTGVFSNELRPVYPTYYINHSEDFITMDVLALKPPWVHQERRTMTFDQMKVYVPSGRKEGQALLSFDLTYDPSE